MREDERDEKYKSLESQKVAGIVDANLNNQERPKHKPAVKVNGKQEASQFMPQRGSKLTDTLHLVAKVLGGLEDRKIGGKLV